MRREILLADRRQPLRVLDHVTVHVGHPRGAIGPGAHHHRPAPAILTRKEISPLAPHPLRFEGRAVGREPQQLHEAMHRFAHQRVLDAGTRARTEEQRIGDDQRTARRGVVSRLREIVIALLRLEHRIHARVTLGQQYLRVRRRDVRIAPEIIVLERIVPKRETVLHAEPAAPRIARAAKLCRSAQRIQFARVGLEAEIACAERDLLPGQRRGDAHVLPVVHVVAAVRAIHPAVGSPAETVEAELLVARIEAGEEHVMPVRPAVAVTILEPNDIGRRRHETAIAPGENAGRETQPFGEQRRAVVDAVAVRVLENPHASTRLTLAIHPERIVGHLDDPEPAAFVPVECHGVEHERFRRGEFDPITGRQVNLPHRVRRRKRRRRHERRSGDLGRPHRLGRRQDAREGEQGPEREKRAG